MKKQMKATEENPIQLPKHVFDLVNKIQERGIAFGLLVTTERTGFESVRLRAANNTGRSPSLSVVISFLVGPEETTTVVYEDSSKPVGQNSATRHYQPYKYLGVTRSTDPEKPIPINNSHHYNSMHTRQDLGFLVLNVIEYLSKGVMPKPWNEHMVVA